MDKAELHKIFDYFIKCNLSKVNEQCLKRIIEFEKEIENENLEYQWFRSALFFKFKNDYDKAVEASKTALNIAHKNNNTYVIVNCCWFLGKLYGSKKLFEQSFKYYLSALKYEDNAIILNNIGDIFLTLGDYQEALKYFKMAEEVVDENKYSLLAVINLNIGACETELGNDILAEQVAKKALNILSKADYCLGYIYAYNLLGLLAMKKKKYDVALAYFNTGLDISKKGKKTRYFMYLWRNYARLLYETGDYYGALAKLEELEAFRIENNFGDKNEQDIELLRNVYSKLGDKDKVCQLAVEYIKTVKEKKEYNQQIRIENFKNMVKVFNTQKNVDKFELLYRNTKIVSDIGKLIISANSMNEVIAIIYKHLSSIMGVNSISYGDYDRESKTIHYKCFLDNNRFNHAIVQVNNELSYEAQVLVNKKAIKINNVLSEQHKFQVSGLMSRQENPLSVKAFIMCPVMIKRELLGLIAVQSKGDYQYSAYDVEVINMIASYIAVAIVNWKKSSELININIKLEKISKTDPLTNINNRYVLDEYVDDIFKMTTDKNESLSVVLIDVDYFKEYNDTYGHAKGDECLIKVANVISKYFNAKLVFRYGGDEFLVITPYLDTEKVLHKVEEVRQSIEALKIENLLSKSSDYLTCSFGVATVYKNSDMNYHKAFALADQALYKAKASGKNIVVSIV